MAFDDAVALTPISLVEKDAVSIASTETPDGSNGNKFFANQFTLFRVINGGGSTITVTVHTAREVEGLAVADDTFEVEGGDDVIYSGFTDIFHHNQQGEVYITYSGVSDVEVQVIQL